MTYKLYLVLDKNERVLAYENKNFKEARNVFNQLRINTKLRYELKYE